MTVSTSLVEATWRPGTESAPLPKVIYIELADYCNLNCMFCGREAEVLKTGDKGGFVEIEQVKKLERALRAATYFGLSGRIGEPLLHPKLTELLEWLYEINPGILLRITTNGTALTRKMAGLLAGHIDFLAISLNASNASAYARDMRPVGHRSGNDWTANWNNLTRRITQFMEALPSTDREKVFVIAPAHRDNIDDLPDFVRLVASMGCSRAVITPMQVHDETKIDMSIYWMKDRYNDVIDQASALGTELGIRVDAARFYQTVKADFDIGALCRDPLDVAYLNMEKQGETAPCCHWAEEKIPMDVYRDRDGFERFWNQDTLQRLRAKRDFKSCKACGLTRAFDEVMFHFTPFLKGKMIASGRIADAEAHSAYPDQDLVRACHKIGLDLPSLRRTLIRMRLPTERLNAIVEQGAATLRQLDRDCWEAFLATDPPMAPSELALAGDFYGLGWGGSEHNPARRVSGRWLVAGRTGSIFVRVAAGFSCDLKLTARQVTSAASTTTFRLAACGRRLQAYVAVSDSGETIISAQVPAAITRAHGGYLWLTIAHSETNRPGAGVITFGSLRLSKLSTFEAVKRTMRRDVDILFALARRGAVRANDLISVFLRLWTSRFVLLLRVVRSDPVGAAPRIWRRLTRNIFRTN